MANRIVKNKKDYNIAVILLTFLTLISVIIFARIIFIELTDGNFFAKDISTSIDTLENNSLTAEITLLEKSIKEKYGVDIFYGARTERMAKQVEANALTDTEEIYKLLTILQQELSLYPDKIIQEIEDKGYDVVVYLVSSFNNSNVALANRTSNGIFNIYISTHAKVIRAIHHELYHILEYYMKLEYDIHDVYKGWDSLNPIGFTYEENISKLNTSYVYSYEKYKEKAFVTVYSKYSAAEDRAELFAEMMTSVEQYQKMNGCEIITNKMQAICYALYNSFVTVKNADNRYWERYI